MLNHVMTVESQRRWAAFWECEMLDRPLLLASAPQEPGDIPRPLPAGKATPPPLPPPDGDVEKRQAYDYWFNIDHMISRNLRRAARSVLGYESTMMLDTGWSVAYCLGMGVECGYNQNAAWCEPLPGRTCASEFAYDFDGPWHRWLMDGTQRMAQAGEGLYYISPVMWGNHSGDTLSNLVGLDRLMLDCIDNPGDVRRALEIITDVQLKAFEEINRIAAQSNLPGTRNYTGTWSPKSGLSFDCDISAMVSPEMYRRILLPPLERMMASVDHRIYHLDGPVCLQHLDTLLSLPQLQAIQWVPGAGHDRLEDWYGLYERIQAAGKSIIVYAHYDQVLEVCKRLRPEGLAICFSSPSEADMHSMAERVAALW